MFQTYFGGLRPIQSIGRWIPLLEVVFTSLLFTLFGSGFYITLFTSLPFTRLTSLSLLSENRQQKDWKAFEFLYNFLSSINTSLFLYGFDQSSFDTILAYTLEEFRKFYSILLRFRNNVILSYYTLLYYSISMIFRIFWISLIQIIRKGKALYNIPPRNLELFSIEVSP